jgi:oligosaccharide repeat unit polymerase
MASWSALVLSVVLIGIAAWMRVVTGTWLQPGSFFSLFWCFAGILPLVLAPEEPVGTNAIFWLIAASIAVSAGAFVGNGGFKTRRVAVPPPVSHREIVTYGSILAISVILGIGSNVAFAKASGLALSDILDIQKLVVATNQAYVSRTADAPPPPIVSQMLLPFVFLAPAIGGIFFQLRKGFFSKALALSVFVPAIGVTVLQTTKAAVLFAITLWLSGYFATRLRFGKLSVFTRGHLLVAGIVGFAVTTLFFATSLARMASTDTALLDVVTLKLITAALGHMTVFSQWLTQYWNGPFEPSLGSFTFSGPLEMLGVGKRLPGLYDSLVDLVAGETSNIYTAFRPLIQDYTIPGALAALALIGFIGGVGFRLVAGGRWSGAPLLLIAYVTIFWTPITWFWIYNSLTGTIVAVGFIVFLVRLWQSGRRSSIQGERFAGTT